VEPSFNLISTEQIDDPFSMIRSVIAQAMSESFVGKVYLVPFKNTEIKD
jgi:hypothetical protein